MIVKDYGAVSFFEEVKSKIVVEYTNLYTVNATLQNGVLSICNE